MIINEIMFAPNTGEAEWIELWNNSGQPVSLDGWTLQDATRNPVQVAAVPATIQPGGYVILAGAAPIAARWKDWLINVLVVGGFPALNNSGDEIVIVDREGRNVDSLRYEGFWNTKKSCTLERIRSTPPFVRDNCGPSPHPDGGTPGARNALSPPEVDLSLETLDRGPDGFTVVVRNTGLGSPAESSIECTCDGNHDGIFSASDPSATVTFPPPYPDATYVVNIPLHCPEAPLVRALLHASQDEVSGNDTLFLRSVLPVGRDRLLFNEIMAAPLPSGAEWIELFNRSRQPISVSGCQLAGAPSSGGVRPILTLPDILPPVPAEGFLVIASDSSVFEDWPELLDIPNAITAVLGRSSLGLGNGSDEIMFLDATGATTDSLIYSETWHNPLVTSTAGRSLELLHPDLHLQGASAWTTCPHPSGGSPGRRNAAYNDTPFPAILREAGIVTSPNPFSPDGDGFEDHCIFSWNLPAAIALLRLRIYDIEGRCIRTLLNSVPSGSTGVTVWDGLDDTGSRARIGMYVVLAEALDAASNSVAATKTIIVVATRL